MAKDVYVVIEQRDGRVQKVGLELLGEAGKLARDLGQKVVALIMGDKAADKAQLLYQYGADRVLTVEDPMLKEYATEPYAKALTQIIREYEPEIVLFGATSIGRDLAPRVAGRVHTGLTADCTGLDIDPETKNLMMTRPAFGGNIMATIICPHYRPQMATVRPGVMKMLERDGMRSGRAEPVRVEFRPEDMNIEILKVYKEEKKSVDITEAKVLVSGGRGVGGPEGYKPLKELADVLGGEVSSSRVGVDSGWIGKDRQVGQTGKTVRPALYVACGISGAIQHLAGMENSEFILAINKDATAPMMEIADLGVEGDLKAIVPKLTEAIKKTKAARIVN
ncbi:MAG: electron transfer flavoprotein subunit alpha/FixB family protein [Peptococcaceae bacterium]|nr:electron transfer flavoprotein subunit alpha/FixB family protein [Peptococcaceae bacterium]